MKLPSENPFAPPKAVLVDHQTNHCRRDGKWVIVEAGSDLPPRCIICNAPAKGPIKRKKLYWHSPWLYLLILVNILIYIIAGLIARKTFQVSPGLCEVHAAQYRRRMFLLVGSGLTAMFAGFMLIGRDAAVACFMLAILLLIISAFAGRKVYARKITSDYIRLGGCKEPFLASLERNDR